MYRIILTENDPRSLRDMAESFPWDKYNMEVIGSFTTPSSALKTILSKKPDAVFTGIRIPSTSGFQLIRTLRERNEDTEFVIISDSDRFEDVREAMRLGALDYYLKPIDEKTADELLSRLKAKLDNKHRINNNYLLELFACDFEQTAINPAFTAVPHVHSGYQVVRISGDKPTSELLSYLPPNIDIEFLRFTTDQNVCYLVNTDMDLFSQLSQNPAKRSAFPYDVGFSSVKNSLQDIRSLISEAAVAANTHFVTGRRGVYHYRPPHYSQLVPVVKRFTQLLQEGRRVEFRDNIEKFPAHALADDLTIEDLCFIWNQLILYNKEDPSRKNDISEHLCADWRELAEKFSSIEDFCLGLQNLFLNNYENNTKKSHSPDQKDSTFGKMIQYINANYTKQIKLKDLAEHFHINKNYASLLFKRHTDMTYSDYMNALRLNHAKELLVSTSLPIAEVSERSGYADYFYFNKIFKKAYGITPAQYRKQPF